jgi:hypothetical protein
LDASFSGAPGTSGESSARTSQRRATSASSSRSGMRRRDSRCRCPSPCIPARTVWRDRPRSPQNTMLASPRSFYSQATRMSPAASIAVSITMSAP